VISGIVCIRACAVIEQAAVVIPGIGLTIDTGQAVGIVIDITGRAQSRFLGEAVAYGVVGVMVERTGGVICCGQPVVPKGTAARRDGVREAGRRCSDIRKSIHCS
jgi:hypothetical protein